MKKSLLTLAVLLTAFAAQAQQWIRINQLGYLPEATKIAVLMSTDEADIRTFTVVDAFTGETVRTFDSVTPTGPLGRMKGTWRLDFSDLQDQGTYVLVAGNARSAIFPVNGTVYDGTADFVLNYMRQQRCGFNPFLRDSCHLKDGVIENHPTKNGQHIDVTGGWHDATDCLQYTTTSANAIYQMMFAYEQNPGAFGDHYQANGLPGANGIPDIVDEIYWGMDWLDRMNPEKGEYYNQIADDRDHIGMRHPSTDPADYGYGPGGPRPVYYVSGTPQIRGRRSGRLNETTGVASITGKYASDFAFGSKLLAPYYPEFAAKIGAKAADAFQAGVDKPGNHQTTSVVSPYIYEEDNWVDDMELAAMELYRQSGDRAYIEKAVNYGRKEPVTPWMGADSAMHYQWYPFMNMGHVRIAENGNAAQKAEFIRNLRSGIERTWEKAKDMPFLYGIPNIWCSNNLTTAMLTQCILYRQLSGDRSYEKMEGALRDWLFGCNPWGVSMIVELPRGGVYPTQPHCSYVRLGLGNATGGLVDGPVYSTIFNNLEGVTMDEGINYMEFQPERMVYHDSIHDYSTNEPTMDGTACLTFPLSFYQEEGRQQTGAREDRNVYVNGGIERTDPSRKRITLVFTAADKADGAERILSTLKQKGIQGAFFFTGEFYELFPEVVQRLIDDGHYVGSHSYGHLLYMPWGKRDSLLVTKEEFVADMMKSYAKMAEFSITKSDAPYFIPPYEYYNSTISAWAKELGLQVVNYTPGTRSNGDYTTPDMKNYLSSKYLKKSLFDYEAKNGLNGHLLLIHFGTEAARKDKFYDQLPDIIDRLRRKGYEFVPLEEAIGLNLR